MTPLINEKALWETSGHWDHYREDMFLFPVDEQTTYGLKPMNCPNAHVIYNLRRHSYRELPLRYSDIDPLHRFERSGTLHGLLRVRKFMQDDAHIFVTEEQIEEEYARILEITRIYYGIFNLEYSLRLGTRPADFMGDPETWDLAEAALLRILEANAGIPFTVEAGEGAFYGPKIDILMKDAIGRSWQTGTIQLDFQQPRRFGCEYIDASGAARTPVTIHRVIYGSLERFVGILLEHFAGQLPLWLAPVQVEVVPVQDDVEAVMDAARSLAARLEAAGPARGGQRPPRRADAGADPRRRAAQGPLRRGDGQARRGAGRRRGHGARHPARRDRAAERRRPRRPCSRRRSRAAGPAERGDRPPAAGSSPTPCRAASAGSPTWSPSSAWRVTRRPSSPRAEIEVEGFTVTNPDARVAAGARVRTAPAPGACAARRSCAPPSPPSRSPSSRPGGAGRRRRRRAASPGSCSRRGRGASTRSTPATASCWGRCARTRAWSTWRRPTSPPSIAR